MRSYHSDEGLGFDREWRAEECEKTRDLIETTKWLDSSLYL